MARKQNRFMNLETKMNSPDATSKKSCTIKVLGVGGAGCNAVDHLARESFAGVTLALINTDAPALAGLSVQTKLNLGANTMRGLGAGGDPERGRAAAEEDTARIRALGGGTGTGASPVVARVAKETGALVLAIVLLPFDCEGSRRLRQAQLGLHELKGAADGVICLPNQKVFRLIDENTSLLKALEITNELAAQGVRGIWRLLSRPGLINVDFADLCAVTKGQHAESCLATAEAQGGNRAREVMEKLLAHPLIEGGQALSESAAVLVSIAGGKGLTMAEVNRIMEQINRHCEQAHVILGAAIDKDLGERLMVTVVAARHGTNVERGAWSGESASSTATAAMGLETRLVSPAISSRPASRFVAPPPALTPGKKELLLAQQSGSGFRQRRNAARMRQGQLSLEIISKGRFEKSEPTIHHGQDLLSVWFGAPAAGVQP